MVTTISRPDSRTNLEDRKSAKQNEFIFFEPTSSYKTLEARKKPLQFGDAVFVERVDRIVTIQSNTAKHEGALRSNPPPPLPLFDLRGPFLRQVHRPRRPPAALRPRRPPQRGGGAG